MQHLTKHDCSSPPPLFEEIHGEAAIAYTHNRAFGIRNGMASGAISSTAHMLTCLHFAGLVAETVARFATGSGGLSPGRAGFAPGGRQLDVS